MPNVYHTCGLAKSTVNYFCLLVNGVEPILSFVLGMSIPVLTKNPSAICLAACRWRWGTLTGRMSQQTFNCGFFRAVLPVPPSPRLGTP